MTFGAIFGAQSDAKRFVGCVSLIPQILSFWLRPGVEIPRGQAPAGCCSSSKTSNICMRIRTSNICINIPSNICMSITSNIYKINTWFLRSPRGQAPWGEENLVFILYILDVILMHILDVILMHILDVLIRMHILDVLLLLLATTVIALLFWEFQP